MTVPPRDDASIPMSRVLIGILLHFCAPAYLLACLATALLVEPAVERWDALPLRMLWTAAWFVPGLIVAMILAAAVGRAVDRRDARAPDPAVASRADLAAARRRLAAHADRRLGLALGRLDAVRCDHADPRCQKIAADADAAARTFAAAIESAAPGRRGEVLSLAADSVERLAAALEQLDADRRRLDEGDAQAVARYIDTRYR